MTNEVEWIKLTTDMFDHSKIKQLRTLPAGNDVVLIWVMLLAMAGKCNAGGMIILTENVPYTVDMLAEELKFETSTVVMALEWLERFNMICREEECFVVKNWYKYQSEDGLEKIREQTRKRNVEYRKRKKLMLEESKKECDVTVTSCVTQSSYSYSLSDSIKSIIDYLNNKTNSRYTYKNKSYNSKIKARLEEGFTVDDFKTVIDKKYNEWHDSDMAQYLTPDTLFAPSKFEKYLNQKEAANGNSQSYEAEVEQYKREYDEYWSQFPNLSSVPR